MKVVCSYCHRTLGKRGCILSEDAVSQDICPNCWKSVYPNNAVYYILLYCEHCTKERRFLAYENTASWELDCTFCHNKKYYPKSLLR